MTASFNTYNNTKPQKNQFYIYLHIDPRNNEIFYVGKGYNGRAWNFSKTSRNSHHFNKLQKLLKLGYSKDQIVHIYKENLNEQCAFTLEKILIKQIGRKDLYLGSLLNFTDGGEGASGRNYMVTEECKEKISMSLMKFYIDNPEHLQKMSKITKERIERQGHIMKGKNHSEESKSKMRESRLEMLKNNPDELQRMSYRSCKYLYWYFDKTGEKYEFFSLRQFCKENNLNRGNINYSIKHHTKHKGIQYYRRLLTDKEKSELFNN